MITAPSYPQIMQLTQKKKGSHEKAQDAQKRPNRSTLPLF